MNVNAPAQASTTTTTSLDQLWLLGLPLLLATFGYLARGLRPSAATLTAFTVTVCGGLVVMFIDAEALAFVVPFAVMFLAFALRDHAGALGWDVNRRGEPSLPAPTPDDLRSPAVRFFAYRPLRAIALIGPLTVLTGALVYFGATEGWNELQQHRAKPQPALDVALWMRENIDEAEAQVFTTDAESFAALFFARPQGRYLVSHSESHLYQYTPQGREPGEVHAMWQTLTAGRETVHDERRGLTLSWEHALRDLFHSELVLVDMQRAHAFDRRLRQAPHLVEQLYRDERYTLYRLRDARRSEAPIGAIRDSE